MTAVPAIFFDGITSQPRDATLHWDESEARLEIRGIEPPRRYAKHEFTVESPLGRGPRFVRFSDGARCEVKDNAALDEMMAAWGPNPGASWLHRTESSWSRVLIAAAVLVVFGWAVLHFALPWGARRIAFALPVSLTRQLGEQTLATLDKTMLEQTQLTHERQLELRRKFTDFLSSTGDATAYRIEFRAAPSVGANAFALPSGTIVITDDLVFLATDDQELLGVLAHECGHVVHRHALRSVLQNSAVFVVMALVTGDVSTATAFGSALPTFLLQNHFSRTFEREADAHAVEKMHAAGVDPGHLADLLQRLATKLGESDSRLLGYLQTHPPTPDRIEAIRDKR